ncbi:leucyl aminopeptidase family protein [bacterium]|nr:leucyl aminopeptidase family protein [candidate division CSSED10-310 bacterium]
MEDVLTIDVQIKSRIQIQPRDTVINMVTVEGLEEALVNHDRFAPHHCRMLERAKHSGDFTGAAGDYLIRYPDDGSENIHIFLGLGSRKTMDSRTVQSAGAVLARKMSKRTVHSALLDLALPVKPDPRRIIKPFLEGIGIGAYTFTKYFKDRKPFPLGRMTLVISDDMSRDEVYDAVTDAAHNIQASNISRHLTTEAANFKTPAKFEALVLENLEGSGLNVRILQADDLEREKLHMIQAVGQAGSDPPRMLIIEHIRDDRPFCLGIVGKAVTFDSGGLMLKARESLPHMRDDMAGAGAVIGAVSALKWLDLDYNVVAAIPVAENLVDSKAYRPADVILTRWGKSVEIVNTDCEGRLLLADAFMYLQDTCSLNAMLDVATLTGAAYRALGNRVAAYFTNDERLDALIRETQIRSREKFWRLPLEHDYLELIRSDLADVSNEGGDPKTISAALFLELFIRENLPWLHLDIGGILTPDRNDPLYGPNAFGSGVPVVSLIEFLRLLNRKLPEFQTD